MKDIETNDYRKNKPYFSVLRRDIVDRQGTLISRNVNSYHAAINPKLIKNKENFLIKMRLHFPELTTKKDSRKFAKKVNTFI